MVDVSQVNVYRQKSGGKVFIAVFDGDDLICEGSSPQHQAFANNVEKALASLLPQKGKVAA